MYIISVLEAFELPVFMQAFRQTRSDAVLAAWVYVVLFVIGAVEWYNQLYLISDKSSYDIGTVYINMLLGYNMVLHFEIVPVCLFIIIKEISMEFFEFLAPKKSEALTTNDFETSGENLLWFLNPFTWLDMWTELLFGTDVEPYVGLDKRDYIYNKKK